MSVMVMNTQRNRSVTVNPGQAGAVALQAAIAFGHSPLKKWTLRRFNASLGSTGEMQQAERTEDWQEYQLVEIT